MRAGVRVGEIATVNGPYCGVKGQLRVSMSSPLCENSPR